MTDVLLFQTDDNGDISIVGGVIETTDDFRTAGYLSLMGGNEDDDGSDNNPLTWWANLDETDPVNRYVSETQNLLRSLPATTGNLQQLEDAARRDLNWMLTTGAVNELDVVATMPGLNRVRIVATMNGDETVNFLLNWEAFE